MVFGGLGQQLCTPPTARLQVGVSSARCASRQPIWGRRGEGWGRG